MNLQELIDETNELLYYNSNSWKVIESKQKELLNIISPSTSISKINHSTIKKYIQTLKTKGNSPNTINAKTAYFKHILKYAYHNNLISNMPFIPTFKTKNRKDKFLNNSEILQIIQWCRHNKQTELLKIILIGLYTGLRINNILSLQPDNIQNNNLQIYDKKVNSYYTLPISRKIRYILNPETFIPFEINYQRCYYLFNQMKKELLLDNNITIHTLRHSFCSFLVQKDVPIPIIQRLANHKSINTTLRYTHTKFEQLKNAVDML